MSRTTAPADLRDLLALLGSRGSAVSVALPDARVDGAGLQDLSRRAASVLAMHGVREGDIVLTVCDNSIVQLAAWLGSVELGAVFAPLSTLLVGSPLGQVARHSGARLMVCQQRHHAAVESMRDSMPSLQTVLVDSVFLALLDAADPNAYAAGGNDPAAPARLMYTSGTTGDPKGVLWSRHAETLHALKYGDELVRVDPGEHVYSCLPLYHATCQGTLLGTLWRGGHVHVDAHFAPFSFWQRVRECDAVFFPYVGTLLATLDRRPAQPDDADVPVRRVMGSAAPRDRWLPIEERFGLQIEDVWGQTETASCWTRPLRAPATPGTIGQEVDRFAGRVVDVAGDDVSPGAPGELLIRANQPHVLFEGYLGEASPVLDGDGWYHTGDLVTRRGDGDLVFCGRLREAIRRHGEMLSPAQVEDGVADCPGVGSVAAVAVPSPDGVEDEIMLCVTGDVDLTVLDTWCATHLPRALRPRYLRRCDQLPMTPTTKVRRGELSGLGVDGARDRTAMSNAAP